MKTYRRFLNCLLRAWGSCATAALLVAMLAFPAGAWAQDDAPGASSTSSPDQSVAFLNQEDATTQRGDATATQNEGAVTQVEDAAAHNENEPQGKITIMHTNDIHGYYTLDAAGSGSIGFPILQTIKNQIEPDLLLDAGDTFHGQSFATLFEGHSIAVLMNMLDYDATTPGNHDWSYGADTLKGIDASNKYGFAILAANVVDAATGNQYFEQPSIAKEVQVQLSNDTTRTVKVGVLGVIDQGFYSSTAAANVKDVQFANPVAAANEEAQELRNAGCDVVVALTHNADPEGFAAQTSGIDAVVAGHEHVVLDETVKNVQGEDVAVVEAGYYMQYAGVLDLQVSYDDKGTANPADDEWDVTGHESSPISVLEVTADGSGYAPDSKVEGTVSQIEEDAFAIAGEEVGMSSQEYPYEPTVNSPGGWEKVRTEDTPIGHAVTASYLAQTGADLAFENAGGIRAGIPEGAVTAGDLLSISPYGNTLATYELTGAQIRSALEHSLGISAQCRETLAKQVAAIEAGEDPRQYTWPDNSGSVLVSGGATMEIDWSKPEGERIVSIEVNGRPLDDNAVYVVAMNSYLPQKTDEYPQFADMNLVEEWGTCEQALREFVGSNGWENRVYELSGTVSYVGDEEGEGGQEGADDQEQPGGQGDSEGEESAGGNTSDDGDAGQPGDSSKAPSSFAATGDGNAASVTILGALSAFAAGAVVVAARRAA